MYLNYRFEASKIKLRASGRIFIKRVTELVMERMSWYTFYAGLYKRGKNMVVKKTEYFDLKRIMESGQIFRMYETEDKVFTVYSGDRCLKIRQDSEDTVCFMCDAQEFNEYWEEYFDLERDYGAIVKRAASASGFLAGAVGFGAGIRILKQDIWEMMISFIISQQKQILSIRKCIEALCQRFGRKHVSEDGSTWYGFPEAKSIASAGPDGLKGLSLGYRERYIYETSVKYLTEGKSDKAVKEMSYEEAKKYFCTYSGIGEKVADCICLFGAGFKDAFPIDVHIKDILYREFTDEKKKEEIETAIRKKTGTEAVGRRKIIDSIPYSGYEEIIEKNFAGFEGVRGILQQWIFAYELKVH